MTTNPQLDLAFQYISQTKRHVYLTGKAGTGKTTFLHRIRAEVPKHMAVVAPTGVAAINAKGTTIHSLFQLPFGLIKRGDTRDKCRKFSKKKVELLNSIDLLVIDEISMVRADVLDAIDEVLCRIRRNDRPFGGLQLLMIGDLHQLPPVVKDNERYQLEKRYPTAYFFGSEALRRAQPAHIELTHIFRQADEKFINLLNRVRNDDLDEEVLKTLNSRFRPDFDPVDEEGYITLSSHNHTANRINRDKLKRLTTTPNVFKAETTGKFPASMYPNEPELTFKVGAQVMFNKNDKGEDRRYFNGKIGKITAIEDDVITVRCPDDDEVIRVGTVTWENISFEMNAKTNSVEDNVIGTYVQHPLKLAWAITIHKSQGLTFEKVVIDAADAFAHGQVYVALSRCKTFEGIILRSRIGDRSVKTDRVVSDYGEANAENQPGPAQLAADKRVYEIDCLRDLFGCGDVREAVGFVKRALLDHDRALQAGGQDTFRPLGEKLMTGLVEAGRRFLPELNAWGHPGLTEDQVASLDGRLRKALAYFGKLLTDELLPAVTDYQVLTDNQQVRHFVTAKLTELKRTVFVRQRTFAALNEGFDVSTFVRARTDARLDYERANQQLSIAPVKVYVPDGTTHPELYRELARWRRHESEERGVPTYFVAGNSVLTDIARTLPADDKALLSISKFGKKSCAKYGAAILNIVNRFVRDNDITAERVNGANVVKLAGKEKLETA